MLRVIVNNENNIYLILGPFWEKAGLWLNYWRFDIHAVCIMKHAMVLKHDTKSNSQWNENNLKHEVYVLLDYGLSNWKWKYMRIWFISFRHVMCFERRLSVCYVGETVNGVGVFIRFTWTVVDRKYYYYSILNCRTKLLKISSNPLLVHTAALR